MSGQSVGLQRVPEVVRLPHSTRAGISRSSVVTSSLRACRAHQSKGSVCCLWVILRSLFFRVRSFLVVLMFLILHLVYVVFPVPRNSYISSVLEKSQPLSLKFCLSFFVWMLSWGTPVKGMLHFFLSTPCPLISRISISCVSAAFWTLPSSPSSRSLLIC